MTEAELNALATWGAGVAAEPRRRSVDRNGRGMLRAYWALVAVGALALVVRTPELPADTSIAACLICAAALLPSYFWCAGSVGGLPVFPVFALTFVWTYALPLLTAQPRIMQYAPEDHLVAGLAVGGFLLLATFVWRHLGRTRAVPRRTLLMLASSRAVPWLVASLGGEAALWMAVQAGWLSLDRGTFALVVAVALGVSTVAGFVLPYLWSRGELRGGAAAAALVAFGADALTSMTGLLLVNVLSKTVLAVIGMTLGGRRPKLLPVLLLLGCILPLHYGKGRMRELYWARGADRAAVQVTPSQYPAFFAEWYQYSFENLGRGNEEARTESFATRASLIHLFLLARERQAGGTAPLAGATYAIIPALLVPRLLMPDKPASHEGTYLLNIRYGLQRRSQTYTTTIGWGLFNEAYGNFGYAGLAGLALALGAALGAYARWTQGVPEMSARYLAAVLVLAIAFQTEFSAGVLVSSLFQSQVALGALLCLLGARPRAVG